MSGGFQYGLDFTQRLSPEVQEAMARCYANANEFWKHLWYACIVAAARKKPEITSDDVLQELEAINLVRKENGLPLYETHTMSAIGPAMNRAASMGIVAATERLVRSTVGKKNGNLHRVWSSKVYGKV